MKMVCRDKTMQGMCLRLFCKHKKSDFLFKFSLSISKLNFGHLGCNLFFDNYYKVVVVSKSFNSNSGYCCICKCAAWLGILQVPCYCCICKGAAWLKILQVPFSVRWIIFSYLFWVSVDYIGNISLMCRIVLSLLW